MGSNPPQVYIIFSYVELNNLYHLCLFHIIIDSKQVRKVLGNFVVFLSQLEHCGISEDICRRRLARVYWMEDSCQRKVMSENTKSP